MNPETQAWLRLGEHAAAQLSSDFPDRVMRAARAPAGSAPSLLGPCLLSAATAGLCLLAVTLLNRPARATAENNLKDWQQISSNSEALADAQ